MKRIACLPSLCLFGICASVAADWQPTGGLNELSDTTLLPRLRPGVVMRSFSSYDRTGGNNDGFNGTYSALRIEEGDSVIAEMDGPGCIYRIWFTHSIDKEPGLLDRKGEHIRIYLNGDETPVLDVPLDDLFNNSLSHFPNPIAGQGIGGFYSYVPIPYRESCKVVIEGQAVRFYQINYATFPSAETMADFRLELMDEEQKALDDAVALWNDPLGQLQTAHDETAFEVAHPDAGVSEYVVNPGESHGPFLIQGITLDGATADALRWTEIEIDNGEPGVESVRLPLGLFFGQCCEPQRFQSLLFGMKGGTFYNRVPIVCAGPCTIRLHGNVAFSGTLKAYTSMLNGPLEEMGRLAVQVNNSLPTREGVPHSFLEKKGRGHYVGTYLVTQGPEGLPYWLEGDDIWTVDGEMVIHGTGSEDYFNCGWYALEGRLNGPETKPSHGFPVYGITQETMRAAAFRWHLTDPVPFEDAIHAAIEHGGENDKVADYRSAAFYYLSK